MNTSIFYITASIFALGGLWILWQLGVRPLLLDNFRDALFVERDALYALAQSGRIGCDTASYRAVEQLLNGVIRYAHRFTLLSYILGVIESKNAQSGGKLTDFSEQMLQKIDSVQDASVKDELYDIVIRTGNLIPRYVAKSSLPFMIVAVLYLGFLSRRPTVATRKKREAVSAWEHEAYLASATDAYATA